MAFYCDNQSFSAVFGNSKEDPLSVWQRVLFVARFMVNGDTCPQGTSSAHHVATLAGLKASRTDYTTSNENHKTASGQISAAFT